MNFHSEGALDLPSPVFSDVRSSSLFWPSSSISVGTAVPRDGGLEPALVMTKTKHFHAIVVGAGPVGLTAAHALERAGIDFVLLEKRPEIVMRAGANLILQPTGMTVWSQLDLQESIDDVSQDDKRDVSRIYKPATDRLPIARSAQQSML